MNEPEQIAPGKRSRGSYILLIVSIAAALLAFFLIRQRPDVPREAAFMTGILVLAALLWMTEALPLFATSLLVVALEILFLSNPGRWPGLGFEKGASPFMRDILNLATDPVLVLFFGGFLLAQAAVKENVDKAMSSLLLRPFGRKPLWALLGVMLVTALFSMWMSNTATTAMMLTLIIPMTAQLPPGDRFRKALVLSVPFAANIGGMGTPIASPPNAVAIGILQKANEPISFLQWIVLAVPLLLVLLFLTWLLLWFFFRPANPALPIQWTSEPVTRRGWLVVITFVLTSLLWMTDQWHGLPPAVVAFLPAIVLTATRVLNRRDLNSLEWNVLILIGGGIALGAGMQLTGLADLIVRWLPLSETQSSIWLLVVLVTATLCVGTFMSNTATANLLLPIGISATTLLPASGSSPRQVVLGIALVASVAMVLPISTPSNAMAYATEEISTRDMVLVGGLIGLATAILIILFSGPALRLLGLLH